MLSFRNLAASSLITLSVTGAAPVAIASAQPAPVVRVQTAPQAHSSAQAQPKTKPAVSIQAKAHISWNLWKMAKNFINKMTHIVKSGRRLVQIGGHALFVLGWVDSAVKYVNICKHRPIVFNRWSVGPQCQLNQRDLLKIFVGI